MERCGDTQFKPLTNLMSRLRYTLSGDSAIRCSWSLSRNTPSPLQGFMTSPLEYTTGVPKLYPLDSRNTPTETRNPKGYLRILCFQYISCSSIASRPVPSCIALGVSNFVEQILDPYSMYSFLISIIVL